MPIKVVGDGALCNLEFDKTEADGQNMYWLPSEGWLVIVTKTTVEVIACDHGETVEGVG